MIADRSGHRRSPVAAVVLGGVARRGVRACWLLLILAVPGFAQAGKEGAANAAEEKFKAVDPYTKGDPELIRLAGYESLRPFQWADGIQSIDMIEVLGGIDLLWAETAHFKICSSLQSYKWKADQRESDALDREFASLAKRIRGFRPPRAHNLDPWVRLHLYAMRLEQIYAEFCERTGFKDAEFQAPGAKGAAGSGPYLGMKLKPTVLLAEKGSALARFSRRYSNSEESHSHRCLLPGGSMFFGISAESVRDAGFDFDLGLHCAVAAGVVGNLLDGLRGSDWATPLWFDVGLGHWFSRRIDERFTYYASGTDGSADGDLHEWQPRVRGLVENKFAYSWGEMLATLEWPQLTPQAHMLIWSRVDWMMQQKGAKLRAFLEPVSVRLEHKTKEEFAKVQVSRASAGLAAFLSRTPEECDAAWSAWVLKTYAKK